MNIRYKIKELRNTKNMTLKKLSEENGLSVVFLSQLERGLTSIAVDSLENIAKILGVNLSYFLIFNLRIILRVIKMINKLVIYIIGAFFMIGAMDYILVVA